MQRRVQLLEIILLFNLFHNIAGEYFTASSHLHTLHENEKELASKLKDFINKEENKLSKLKNYYKKYQFISDINTHEDISKHIGNPIKAFLTLNRMVKKWRKIREHAGKQNEDVLTSALSQYSDGFPTEEDLNGAQDGLLRLQETFSLSSKEIVEGLSENAQNSKLDVNDAYDIGMKAYAQSRHGVTAKWLSEVLRLLKTERSADPRVLPSKFEVLDHLAWSEYVNNQVESAYEHTLELLKLDPSNERIRDNERYFKGQLSKLKNDTTYHITSTSKESNKRRKSIFKKFYYTPDESNLERYELEKKRSQELCRGETDPIPKRFTKVLVCFYKMDHPMLILKPAKIERVYPYPEILFYRDAMTDYEIMRVKELANPLLQRATVHNPTTGKLEFADYRVSKSAWLDEHDDILVEKMSKRIEAYTGLSMDTAEKLQVANYGIGGHYETHFDFARTVPLRPPPWKHPLNYTTRALPTEKELKRLDGNRIATMLFYMSDVERGGATVFTNIGQAVKPSKGDAVFWYNLHPDGSGNYDTRHAACPVLIGEKWVSNRWIHERGQEFRHPCKLRPEDD